jgi:hypothetical protein
VHRGSGGPVVSAASIRRRRTVVSSA